MTIAYREREALLFAGTNLVHNLVQKIWTKSRSGVLLNHVVMVDGFESSHPDQKLFISIPPIAKMNPEDLEKLVTFVMPYGKHKGRVIADIPGNYLNWFAREGFPTGELGRLLALMQEMDHNGLRPLLDPLRK